MSRTFRKCGDVYADMYESLQEAAETGVKFTKPIKLSKSSGFYGNTVLLSAISYNDTDIALLLILLAEQRDKAALKKHDSFSGSRSSPLILAAKTANNPVAMTLLSSRHVASFIHEVDYQDNTAMHYACLMRNMLLVKMLYEAGASFTVANRDGKTPEQYLTGDIRADGLNYPYGQHKTPHGPHLIEASDFGHSFYGTYSCRFSAYRWFIALIVMNLHLTKDVKLSGLKQSNGVWIFDGPSPCYVYRRKPESDSLHDTLQFHANNRMSIMDGEVYKTCCDLFYGHRESNQVRNEAMQFAQQSKMVAATVLIDDYFSGGTVAKK